MALKICLKLLLGLFAVKQELLPRAESQATNVAIGDTWCGPDEPYDLKITFCHGGIVLNLRATNLLRQIHLSESTQGVGNSLLGIAKGLP